MENRKQRDYSDYKECKCIICERKAYKKTVSYPKDGVHYHCNNCGDFYVTEEFEDRDADIHGAMNRPMVAGYIRECFENGDDGIWIGNGNIQEILNSPLIPQTPSEKINKLVCYLDRNSEAFSQELIIPDNIPAICYAENDEEFARVIDACIREGFIFAPGFMRDSYGNLIFFEEIRLSLKGHQYAEELRKTRSNSTSAFVAMWFSDEVREAYEAGIKVAIEAKECGQFKAFRVDNLEHNDDVTDKIIAEIKAARFVVADLTGNRGGVYYEAGFARGLGKPVILTCHKDWFNGNDENHKVHFDVNHLSIILWENAEELKEKLINRIRATIL